MRCRLFSTDGDNQRRINLWLPRRGFESFLRIFSFRRKRGSLPFSASLSSRRTESENQRSRCRIQWRGSCVVQGRSTQDCLAIDASKRLIVIMKPANDSSKRCSLKKQFCRRAPSSSYENTRLVFYQHARKCEHQSSRVELGANSPANVRCDSHQNRLVLR